MAFRPPCRSWPFALLLALPCQAADSDKPAVSKDSFSCEQTVAYTASSEESFKTALQNAKKMAYDRALEDSGNVNIASVLVDKRGITTAGKSHEFISNYIFSFAAAQGACKMKDYKIEEASEGATKYSFRFEGTLSFKGRPDPAFEIRFDAKEGGPLGLNQPSFFEGDRVRLRFWVTKESHIHLLVIDAEENVYLLYPNKRDETPGKLKAGEVFSFPPKDKPECPDDQQTVFLGGCVPPVKAALPRGVDETIEYLHIIATKDDQLFTVAESSETSVGEGYELFSLKDKRILQKRLAQSDRARWTQRIIPYQIQKRQE
ncbi:MAG: DUF4384 domain-containing protein [Elusimicrobia bacterium]|nr:DUF4384 domain-containing protein [Elusimicrobiota bacterium]